MAQRTTTWGQGVILFVVTWLIAVYVYDCFQAHFSQTLSLILAIGTFVLSGVARWQAVRSVGTTNWAFHFWMAVPLLLFILVPLITTLASKLAAEQTEPWWTYVQPLLPVLLRLGVPILGLLWVHRVLGRLGRATTDVRTAATVADAPPATPGT